ncbi:MAG: 3-deoxy-D-manno-octulosonic acid transferase [Flavobacteriales bacterium]
MSFLYHIGLYFYVFLIRFSAWCGNPKAALWIKGRQYSKAEQEELKRYRNGFLIQCSSLGEYEQGKPLIEALRRKFPKKPLILTFFSPSGYEAQKTNTLVDKVLYLPLDTVKKSRVFVDLLQPEKAFFIKYDFWPNLYQQLHNQGTELYLISAIFRPNQLFFKPILGRWYKQTLRLVDRFFVQNESSKTLLESIGLTKVEVAGDTRIDQVLNLKHEPFSDSIIEAFLANHPGKKVIILGSSWGVDEQLFLELIQSKPNCIWIVAPHEIHQKHIETIQTCYAEFQTQTYTDFDSKSKSNILIINKIGKLKYLYRYADLAYIGGGFGVGIHNTLEPAVYGIPLLFGPNNIKFQEAQDFKNLGLAIEVSKSTLVSGFQSQLSEENQKIIKEKSKQFFEEKSGAVRRILEWI